MSELEVEVKEHERATVDCRECDGNCCRYIALQIDTPETPEDFDHLRWYMAHEKVVIFIEKKDWYLQVNTPCRYLLADNKCGYYEKRPQICRDYGMDSEGETECHGMDRPCDHDEYFTTLEELEAYLLRKGHVWASLKHYAHE